MVVKVEKDREFEKSFKKIKDSEFKKKVRNQIKKIIENPEAGKPMRNSRKGTRELYIKPYRLSYAYISKKNKVVLLDIYHKDKK